MKRWLKSPVVWVVVAIAAYLAYQYIYRTSTDIVDAALFTARGKRASPFDTDSLNILSGPLRGWGAESLNARWQVISNDNTIRAKYGIAPTA